MSQATLAQPKGPAERLCVPAGMHYIRETAGVPAPIPGIGRLRTYPWNLIWVIPAKGAK